MIQKSFNGAEIQWCQAVDLFVVDLRVQYWKKLAQWWRVKQHFFFLTSNNASTVILDTKGNISRIFSLIGWHSVLGCGGTFFRTLEGSPSTFEACPYTCVFNACSQNKEGNDSSSELLTLIGLCGIVSGELTLFSRRWSKIIAGRCIVNHIRAII